MRTDGSVPFGCGDDVSHRPEDGKIGWQCVENRAAAAGNARSLSVVNRGLHVAVS